jgi:hypothetical protein
MSLWLKTVVFASIVTTAVKIDAHFKKPACKGTNNPLLPS